MSTKKKILTAVLGVEVILIAAFAAFLFYLNSDTVKITRQLELAQRYLLEEDYEQAIAAFEAVIETDPKNVDAYLGLAQAYAETDELEKAVKILERGFKRTDSEEIKELLDLHTEGLAQAESRQQMPETVSRTEETSAALHVGFVTQEGELYFYDGQGNLVTGWFETGGNRYYAGNDGKLYRGGEYEVEGVSYLFDQKGICLGEMEESLENTGSTPEVFAKSAGSYCFASGVGGWSTDLDLKRDGTFVGCYFDTNAGESGNGYDGTVYQCEFHGRFKNPVMTSDYVCRMELDYLEIDSKQGEETIQDFDGYRMRFVNTEPYGMEVGEEFYIYLPGAPLSELPEPFVEWVSMPMAWWDNPPETMPFYGIYNVEGEYGFFGGQ